MRGGSCRGLQSRGLAPPDPSRPDRCQGDHLPGLPFSQAHIALSPRLTRLTQESLVLPFPSCRVASILKVWFREPPREPLLGVHGARSVFTIMLRELPLLPSFSRERAAEFSRGHVTRSRFSKTAVPFPLPPCRFLSSCGGLAPHTRSKGRIATDGTRSPDENPALSGEAGHQRNSRNVRRCRSSP